MDTIHVILSWHMIYYYLVTNYDTPSALTESVWCVFVLCHGRSVTNGHACVGVGMYVQLGYVGVYLRLQLFCSQISVLVTVCEPKLRGDRC